MDAAVAGALLDALTPGQVALALSAADEVAGRHQRASRAAELAVERARYDADRAERAFCAVEPENRLVARSLEARWEARLAALTEAEQALEAAQDTLPPLPSRDDLEKLAADLPALWNAPTTSARDRKRLLRTLIADVTLLPEPDQAKVRIGIRWHTGATDELIADRPVPPGTAKRSPPRPSSWSASSARPPAPPTWPAASTPPGWPTGHGRPFDVDAVQWIRHAYKIPAPSSLRPRRDSAWPRPPGRLGCSTGVVYHWIHTGQLDRPPRLQATGCASPGRPGQLPHGRQSATWAGPPAPQLPARHLPGSLNRATSPAHRQGPAAERPLHIPGTRSRQMSRAMASATCSRQPRR